MISKNMLNVCEGKLKAVFKNFELNEAAKDVWIEALNDFTDKEFYAITMKALVTCKRAPVIADFFEIKKTNEVSVEYTEKKPVSVKIIDRCKVHCVSHFNGMCNNTACVRYEDLLKEQFGKQYRNEDMSKRPPEYLRLVEIMKTMK